VVITPRTAAIYTGVIDVSILTSRPLSEFWKIFDPHNIGVRQHPRYTVFSPDMFVFDA
jgi:hypothetical protein